MPKYFLFIVLSASFWSVLDRPVINIDKKNLDLSLIFTVVPVLVSVHKITGFNIHV